MYVSICVVISILESVCADISVDRCVGVEVCLIISVSVSTDVCEYKCM